ncbi:hypothetical protein BP6252_03456 [Coleophoma cylindrospora]|uniref:Transcription factor domain-containing protein n=1 Tax=Coleophoma cylindrospora TaxID=1849047 RepID=A0A3D8S8D6_9HELO|nr:hypothetical protein BP6252_03456 [Coleophoma cylindrospora]
MAHRFGSINRIEESLKELTEASTSAIKQLQDAVADINKRLNSQGPSGGVPVQISSFTSSPLHSLIEAMESDGNPTLRPTTFDNRLGRERNLVEKGIITMAQCIELFHFYREHCNGVVACIDSINEPLAKILQSPLLLATLCTIGARALRSKLYQTCRLETDALIQKTFTAPKCDLPTLKAMMLYATWHRSARILGHMLSLCYEMGLQKAPLALTDPSKPPEPEIVEMARTWLSFCCIDMLNSLHGPYLISNVLYYATLGRSLCSSPHFRTVDYRIMAYLELYAIAGEAKASLTKEALSSRPLSVDTQELFLSLNAQLDTWFHKISNEIDPLYQTYSTPQDRNRMLIPYASVRMYINGSILYGIEPTSVLEDAVEELLGNAVEAGKILLRTALQSSSFKTSLRYTIDYSGSALFLAIHFLYKAVLVARRNVNVASITDILRRVVQLFKQADATEHAETVERMLARITTPDNQSLLLTSNYDRFEMENVMYDIQGSATEFVSDPAWQQHFPLFDPIPTADEVTIGM